MTKDYNFPLLIVEDDADDIDLLRRVLARTGTANPLHIVNNGEEAINYLSGQGKYCDRVLYPLPRLMIADIKMPRRNGFELLAWLHVHPEVHLVPILILTSSNLPRTLPKLFDGVHTATSSSRLNTRI